MCVLGYNRSQGSSDRVEQGVEGARLDGSEGRFDFSSSDSKASWLHSRRPADAGLLSADLSFLAEPAPRERPRADPDLADAMRLNFASLSPIEVETVENFPPCVGQQRPCPDPRLPFIT